MRRFEQWPRVVTFLAACVLVITACVVTPASAPTLVAPAPVLTLTPAAMQPSPGRVVISELLPGLPDNNNAEFVELYNAGTEPVDLRGWSLWYRMSESQELQRLHLWTGRSELPGHGHQLLVRGGADFQVLPDVVYDVPLYERKGGLVLRDAAGAAVDSLGWGDAPTDLTEGGPAPSPEAGASLERIPGGVEGSSVDTSDNASDFVLRAVPDPQSSGSLLAPLPAERLVLILTAPITVTPGTDFPVEIRLSNATGGPVAKARIVVAVPGAFGVVETPYGATYVPGDNPSDAGEVAWTLESMAPDEVLEWTMVLRSPWSYGQTYLRGSYVEAQGFPLRAYGELVPLSIEGGAIPIGVARTLAGNVVTVEGVATMYTGGFYAGTTGTKFYLQDESGGVQVYCPGGQGQVNVRIGDRVQVTGKIEIYRDSLELVPAVYPDDVAVLARQAQQIEPEAVTVEEATRDFDVLGRLITVSGQVTRLEEFSYSYEMDLVDESGDVLLVYIDKESYLDPDFVDVGDLYQVTGISELYDDKWQLKPRVGADFARVYPPELMLDLYAVSSVNSGELITYTISAQNHTELALGQVQIATPASIDGAEIEAVLDGGTSGLLGISWSIPELAPKGGQASVRYVVRVGDTSRVVAPPASATADGWPTMVQSPSWLTFVGSGVPIWAIQGDGKASPFVRRVVATEGIVTGVFPDLGGFWMASLEPDGDPATSEGLFVQVSVDEDVVTIGDRAVVTGTVRERSGQTLLALGGGDSIVVTSQGNALPAAVELAPPRPRDAAVAYYEALEGMLVQVTVPAVAVGPTTQYGEYALVRQEWGIERVMKGEPTGLLIFVDDGSDVTHLDRSSLPYAVKVGDSVSGVLGPLAFTYDAYKVEPITMPTVLSTDSVVSGIEPAGEESFSVATFNVENLFDVKDPHPSSPPRPSIREYHTKLAKTAETLVAMGLPTVVGLQEVENLGILEDLVAEPAIAAYGYVPVLLEGLDSRGIDVGYLVRGDMATLEGVSQHPAPEGLTSRQPLLITVTVHLDGGDQTLYLLNNHFASMSGGEQATEAQRMAQAAWNVTLTEEILAQDPGALVAVMGDLNSFYDSPPLDVLRTGGLRHVYELTEPGIPYTYIYQGESETLDHILVTDSLYRDLVWVEALHTNADFPLASSDDLSPLRVSDHDPLVVIFQPDNRQ